MRNRLAQYRAKILRHQSTDAERHLWVHLRRRQLEGFRFRRQCPLNGYIVDFICIETRLVIELDGSQHQQRVGYDARRDAAIAAAGFRVLRFWNNQVFEETTAVLEVILRALNEKPPPP